MQEPDPATVHAAMAGDLDAFEALVRAYQVHVWRFLRHLLGDAALAEDITQETLLRVHQRLSTYRFQSKFSTWVFQVARNAGIDALRARSRRDRLVTRLVSPGQQASDPSIRVELAAALASLAPKLREAVTLVEVFGLPYREAATVLGVPEGTVKSRVFRARGELVRWLRAGEGPGASRAL